MISRTTLHAVRALVFLAKLPPGTYAGAASIADAIDAPQNYLGKTLQALCRRGLLHSQKGFGGGFCLARDPDAIHVLEVAELLDDVSGWSRCFLGQAVCSSDQPCPVHHRWGPVRDAYLALLRETTIATLSRPGGAPVLEV